MKQCIDFVLRCFNQAVKAILDNQHLKQGGVEMEQTGTAKAATNLGIDGSAEYVIDILKRIDAGEEVYTDFMCTPDVDDFCRLAGFTRSWAGKTDVEIAPKSSFGPKAVPEAEAMIILNMLQAQVDKGTFTYKYPEGTPEEDKKPFNTTILKDFLPKVDGGLGHIWEYQYGLAVELEHGRTLGTNVTNNHPLITGMIVMAHLIESTLYYARLWVMEVEGEIFELKRKNEGTVEQEAELARAKLYLAGREAEKLPFSMTIPT